MDFTFDLKLMAGEMRRSARTLQTERKKEIAQARRIYASGDKQGARIHAESAAFLLKQAHMQMRMAARLDATACLVKAIVSMRQMEEIVGCISSVTGSLRQRDIKSADVGLKKLEQKLGIETEADQVDVANDVDEIMAEIAQAARPLPQRRAGREEVLQERLRSLQK